MLGRCSVGAGYFGHVAITIDGIGHADFQRAPDAHRGVAVSLRLSGALAFVAQFLPRFGSLVETNLTGSPADALEQLQGKYENDPGFLAVVFDGTKPIVIVEATAVPVWEGRLGPTGIAVAPSCINPELLRAVHAVLPSLSRSSTAVSAGYNGLEDRIDVLGVDAETLISDLDKSDAAIGAAARVAVANGTLRINPARLITAPR